MRVGFELYLFEPYISNTFSIKEVCNVLFSCFYSLFYIHLCTSIVIPGGLLAFGSYQDAIGER